MKRQTIILLLLVIAVVLGADLAYALSGNRLMVQKAKEISGDNRYAIVTSYVLHRTKVYDTEDDYKVVALSRSCGPPKPIYGAFYLTGKKEYDRQGSKKDENGSVYHEYYCSWVDKGIAIHTLLYNRGSEDELYDEQGVQDKEHPYSNNWSNGCTRASKELCKFVYENCEKGTPYAIM